MSHNLLSDSHGRNLDNLLQRKIAILSFFYSSVRPGAIFETNEIVGVKNHKTQKHPVLLTGANEAYNGNTSALLQALTPSVLSLKPSQVLLKMIPCRRDILLSQPVREDIMRT